MIAKLCPLPLALAVVDKAIFNFSNQWLAGLQPQLMLETDRDGQIWVSSRVVAGDTPTHSKLVLRRHAEEAEAGARQAGDAGLRPPLHRRPRRHGPARHRRRLRREAARAAAAAASTADKAEEKTADKEENVPSAARAAHSPTHLTQGQVVAAEALSPVLQPPNHHDQKCQNFRSVRDEVCPDGVYDAAEQAGHHRPQSPNIPQVDGIENADREWWCYCCEYAKLFETEELLHQHHDDPDHFVTYEECNICYPWHVWT